MKISVLGIQSKYFIRPKNTDWRHNFFLEKAFAAYKGRNGTVVDFTLRRSLNSALSMNLRYLKGPAQRFFPFLNLRPDFSAPLFRADKQTNFDILYSYDCYPSNPGLPVIWHNGPTDIVLLKKRGVSDKIVKFEIESKAFFSEKAALIAVSSESAKMEFNRQLPGHLDKIVVLPFILPNIAPPTVDQIVNKHRNAGQLNILFVGREANRKGLDLVISAFTRLAHYKKNDITLTIVSNFADGPLYIPALNSIKLIRNLAHSDVQKLMWKSHIYVMPSREESYGLAYIEAMAAGAVPIAPKKEPQISLLNNGLSGSLCEISVDGVFNAINELIEDCELRIKLASHGFLAYEKNFAMDGVLSKYSAAFERIISAN